MTCCPEHALCPMHLEDRFMQLKGVAAMRAHTWLTSLRARNIRGAWDSAKALDIARLKVADLARDPELRERLAAECERVAGEEWASVV